MEGCKTIFGSDKGKERLGEICLIGPVRTRWKEQTAKKNYYPNGKWISKLTISGQLLVENKQASVWSQQTQTSKIVISQSV